MKKIYLAIPLIFLGSSAIISVYLKSGDLMTTNISQFVSYQNGVRQAQGWSSNLDAEGPQTTATVNSVIGWQSASLPTSNTPWMGGNNVVLLDGARGNYGVQIDGTGQLMIKDIGTGDANNGQSITVTGASYAIFSGGATASPGVYNQIMMIQKGDDATLARMYESSFGRMPDPVGYESWKAQLDSGQMSLQKIGQSFVQSSEFQNLFGANSSDQQFVDALYTNVLGRTADKAGEAGYTSYLGSIEPTMGVTAARASLLVAFAGSSEEISHSSSWLVDPSKGGFADSTVLVPTQTALNQADATNFLNTALVEPPSPSHPVQSGNYTETSVNGVLLTTNGFAISTNSSMGTIGTVFSGAQNATIFLSSNVPNAVIYGASTTVHSGPSAGVIDLYSSSNTITLSGGGATVIQISPAGDNQYATGQTIYNFTSGRDTIEDPLLTDAASGQGNRLGVTAVTLLDATTGQHFTGAALTWDAKVVWTGSTATVTQPPAYVLEVGNVGGGTAAEVAAVVNRVYTLTGSDTPNHGNHAMGEHLTIVGQTSSGDTVIYNLVNVANWMGTNMTTPNPDLNHNGIVDANELTYIAKLVGVSHLVAHDL
ncbi:MAG: DUF4214 domain-containing protein [Methanobacterium sp.]|nr:DUF4214 domain-containing protein [Methanobacterium sp.]